MDFIAFKPLLKSVFKYIKPPAVPAVTVTAIAAALAVTALVYYARSPVLVVTDAPFIELYGKERIRGLRGASSLALFRRVKPVITGDGASPDLIVEAVSGAAGKPYCVLFPGYLANAAERFHTRFPETPAVILGGYGPYPDLPRPDGVLCVYRTDIETDLYRAGLFAGLIGLKKSAGEAQRTCFLWQDSDMRAEEKEAFSRGLRESDPGAGARFAVPSSDIPDFEGISCAVLTRSGGEYMERNAKIPLVLFTWLDTSMLPAETAAVFDDAAWALVVPATRMAAGGRAEGKIPSKPLIFSGKTADNGIGGILKQLAKKTP